MIPKRLVRVVPEHTSDESEHFWRNARAFHPAWEHATLRDPIDPTDFPITADLWPACESGAQLADLIRAEELYQRGGIYLDSDVDCWRPFDVLTPLEGFAGWEDSRHICNAVIGFRRQHPALLAYLKAARELLPHGTWRAGVGAFTQVMARRHDVALLPPHTFYPWHYTARNVGDQPATVSHLRESSPWSFAAHYWRHSWKETDHA